MSAIPSLTELNRTWRGQPISGENDPKQALVILSTEFASEAYVRPFERFRLRHGTKKISRGWTVSPFDMIWII
jgi:hypothetical protein